MDVKIKLSILWVVVMLNMVFADILSFMLPGFLNTLINGETDIIISQGLLLIFAILLEIPILMIFFSRVLKYRINRILNIVAAVISIVFVVGGGTFTYHYIFFTFVEVVCMVFIIKYAWEWKEYL